jgi:hypothetical protein
MELKVSAIFPSSPVQEPGSRTEKSPFYMVRRLERMTLKDADAGSATRTELPLFFPLFLSAAVFMPDSFSPLAICVAATRVFFFIVLSWSRSF